MTTYTYKHVYAGLMTMVVAERVWASESAAQAAGWAGVGLWIGVAAAVFFGGGACLVWLKRSRGSIVGGPSGAKPEHVGGEQAAVPRGYNAKNVGNDASARPWESSLIGASLSGSPVWSAPDDFDIEAFLESSKANFVSLQSAWDRSDIPSLRAMMTDSMLEQITSQLAERERASGGKTNTTDVVMLDARFLGIEDQAGDFTANVEFSGMLREDPSAGPNPFREVWSITRDKANNGGWLVAGVQAMQ